MLVDYSSNDGWPPVTVHLMVVGEVNNTFKTFGHLPNVHPASYPGIGVFLCASLGEFGKLEPGDLLSVQLNSRRNSN